MDIKEIETKLSAIQKDAIAAIAATGTTADLESVRQRYQGKKSDLEEIMRGLKDVSKEDRPKVGQLANAVKVAIESSFKERRDLLYKQELNSKLSGQRIDVTLPG